MRHRWNAYCVRLLSWLSQLLTLFGCLIICCHSLITCDCATIDVVWPATHLPWDRDQSFPYLEYFIIRTVLFFMVTVYIGDVRLCMYVHTICQNAVKPVLKTTCIEGPPVYRETTVGWFMGTSMMLIHLCAGTTCLQRPPRP